jgi:DNA-binding transcriptional LysR family regulator
MRLQDPRLDAHRLHREEYVLVASPALARRFRAPADAARHTLIDTHAELPLFGYFRDAPRGGPLPFRRYLHMGTIAAVRALALRGDGVAMLPLYLVAPDLRARRLRRLLPRVEPLADHFRLFFRADDPRRSLFQALASTLLREPLR